MLAQIRNSFSSRQYELAARTADEAIRIYGNWEYFLYYRSLAQRLSGNTGKSVSGFEELVKRWPDKAVYYKELAISRLERGYANKAQEAFGAAYERGIRDEEFLYLYANNSLSQENEELWNSVEEFSEIIGMDRDPEIPMWYIASLHGYKDVEEPAFGRYILLDLSLCILEEWPGNRELLKKIEENYPIFYQPIADFVKQLETYADTGRISELRDRLIKDYDKLNKSYEGGFYYEKYPHRNPNRVRVIRKNNGEPFVRTDRKIGRNDPCPCGSGKKYKNCCGR